MLVQLLRGARRVWTISERPIIVVSQETLAAHVNATDVSSPDTHQKQLEF
jgi:hypothetical protein